MFWKTIVPTKSSEVVHERARQLLAVNGCCVNRVTKLLDADERAAGGAVPVEEGVAERGDHRVEHEDPEEDQRRGDEQHGGRPAKHSPRGAGTALRDLGGSAGGLNHWETPV